MIVYRERLWPSVWIYLVVALVIPASILVFAPISIPVGVIVAAVLFLGATSLVTVLAPVIVVTDAEFTAGKAVIPRHFLGEAEAFARAEATLERGQRLDARAWLCLRGWVDPVVKIPLRDPADPTPYWLVSTRNPEGLKAALSG